MSNQRLISISLFFIVPPIKALPVGGISEEDKAGITLLSIIYSSMFLLYRMGFNTI